MSPGPRRDLAPFVTALVVGAVILFLFVGGLASVGRSSGAYHASINGSFGAQAKVFVSESNAVGTELASLVAQMPGLSRSELALRLDDVVSGAQAVAASAQQASSTAPAGASARDFAQAMTDRAEGMATLRTAVEGLLSITPAGGAGTTAAPSPFPPPQVSIDEAARAITAVGQLLVAADRSYRNARSEFSRLPGGSELPSSVWVRHPVVWGAGAVQTTLNQLSSSPTLAALVDVRLAAVALNPTVLPPLPAVKGQPQAPPLLAGAVEIPPTCTVSITAVVRNDGSLVVAKAPVRASVQPVSGGPAFVVNKSVTLAPSASRALALPVLAVQPGTTYALTVTIDPPAGQSGPVGTQAATIAVASFGSAAANSTCARIPAAAP